AAVSQSVRAVLSADLNDTQWHHVLVSFDRGAFKLYMDWQLVDATETGYDTVNSALNEAAIGARFGVDAFGGSGGGAHFNGVLDDIRMYQAAVIPSIGNV